MSAIVPWTTPGAAPCCCVAACPDLGNGPSGLDYLTATRFSISEETYVSLYAGGVMRVEFSGNASGTSVSVFDANISCAASGDFSRTDDFLVSPNNCISESTRTLISKNGDAGTPQYRHYLESDGTNYSVFFSLAIGGTAGQDCGFLETGVAVRNETINNSVYSETGTSSDITVILPDITLTVPTQLDAFPTLFFFNSYTSVSGSVSGTYTWTSSAP